MTGGGRDALKRLEDELFQSADLTKDLEVLIEEIRDDLEVINQLRRIGDALVFMAGGRSALDELDELRELAGRISITRTQEGTFVSDDPQNRSQAADLVDRLMERNERGEPL